MSSESNLIFAVFNFFLIFHTTLNSLNQISCLAACKEKKCGKHQFCMVENGKPKCVCKLNCNENHDAPVCGLKNGKQYKNRCLLRKEECMQQKDIGIVPGPCKRKLNHYLQRAVTILNCFLIVI